MKSLKGGRAQAAAGAAVLIAIIAGLMVMFVILIPPQERAKLLDENYSGTSSSGIHSSSSSLTAKNLLTASPGRIDYLAQSEIEHPIPVVTIYTSREGRILAERSRIKSKNAVFTEETSDFTFTIHNLDHTSDVLLNFFVQSIVGDMIIELNGQEIFSGSLKPGASAPISLPKSLLQKDNRIELKSISPGIAFWRTHEAVLNKVKVVADVKNVEAQSSKNVFLILNQEKKNLERGLLKFTPECKPGEVGKLRVKINGKELYNAIPDCDIKIIPVEFSTDLIHVGENQIEFFTEEGTYILSHVLIESKLKDLEFPTYYFDLSLEEFEEVQAGGKRVRLEMDFVDVVTVKRADIVFNGHLDSFETKEVVYTMDLSEDVVKGNNAIKIKPKKTLEIRELRMDLVK